MASLATVAAGHRHGSAQSPDGEEAGEPRLTGRSAVALLSLVAVVLVATGAGLVLLWPRAEPSASSQAAASGVPGVGAQDVSGAEVVSSSATTCQGAPEDRQPDGTIPATTMCASAVARVTSGASTGKQITVSIPPQVYRAGIAPGDRIDVAYYAEDGGGWAWVDFSRGLPLGILALIFAGLVVLVARLRGLAAMFGLAVAYLAIVRFTLPALRAEENALSVALVTSVAVMAVVLYLAHGFSMKTTAAYLGTVFGLMLTTALAWWAASSAHLNGLSSEENYTLSQLTGNRDLSGIILCGIIIAGLGVLNDVTVTQASAVWEVHAHAPDIGVRGLFRSGMRIGRDHLASTVYTIAFAYAGAALPTLLLIDFYGRPFAQVITSGQIAEEVVRTLVGSIGLILAIPVTTLIAALAVAPTRPSPQAPSRGGGRALATADSPPWI